MRGNATLPKHLKNGTARMPFELIESISAAVNHHFRKRMDFEWSEEFFLGAISSARSKYDVYWSVVALRKVGTAHAPHVGCEVLCSAYNLLDRERCRNGVLCDDPAVWTSC
jgi:hypothetical protein